MLNRISLVERIFRSLNKQRLPSLGVRFLPPESVKCESKNFMKITTVCKDDVVHETILLATHDREHACAIGIRILFQDYYDRSGHSVLKLGNTCNFWKPYVIPFILQCASHNVSAIRREGFQLELIESFSSHASHLGLLGESKPVSNCRRHSNLPARFFGEPVVSAIRRLVHQMSFVSTCTGHIVQIASSEKTYVALREAAFTFGDIDFSIGSYAMYCQVIRECFGEGFQEAVSTTVTSFHFNFTAFSDEMKLVFLNSIMFGGNVELEFDAKVIYCVGGIVHHTFEIYAFSSKDSLDRARGLKYKRSLISAYSSSAEKRKVKMIACKRALQKFFTFDEEITLAPSVAENQTTTASLPIQNSWNVAAQSTLCSTFLPNDAPKSLLHEYRQCVCGNGERTIEEKITPQGFVALRVHHKDSEVKEFVCRIASPLCALLECYRQVIDPESYRSKLQKVVSKRKLFIAQLQCDVLYNKIARAFRFLYGLEIQIDVTFTPSHKYSWAVYMSGTSAAQNSHKLPLAISKGTDRNSTIYTGYRYLVSTHLPQSVSVKFLSHIPPYPQETTVSFPREPLK